MEKYENKNKLTLNVNVNKIEYKVIFTRYCDGKTDCKFDYILYLIHFIIIITLCHSVEFFYY